MLWTETYFIPDDCLCCLVLVGVGSSKTSGGYHVSYPCHMWFGSAIKLSHLTWLRSKALPFNCGQASSVGGVYFAPESLLDTVAWIIYRWKYCVLWMRVILQRSFPLGRAWAVWCSYNSHMYWNNLSFEQSVVWYPQTNAHLWLYGTFHSCIFSELISAAKSSQKALLTVMV